ncbi:GPI anchored serine-threonine rich family protein [Aspergillus luchuensis]|uniref:Yeast cell wall synthesis Kre9/Knh1-like N-terminal domain-containing protein n=3 Tax=Aspergillus subgen. Circumdati TaxID=2720871 RepID=A0A146FT81_ASPKA|nr:hypothetical protein BO85DRAFT_50132 [Aspergillus piperis CBS 112811]XP_041547459.1 uncharacterized protein AKAW2_70575S [Aspergillus luchuensis]OJZ86424.1 hypothetical protein ASPFODRAFT_206867 [Aspergillus luchuensis CBS 106.47]GAA89250.1 hypothetical protein AKAW_07364 [Aspergillus luchuensis IFO 4308]RAH56444.1 hypothetical protein BO85DRAFT_50132 [Aspergillus piperis CBS 112811]BCS03697.1 hypothetical protein AKAW2_70575S [Aspergillus luchuensis]BCS15317.1 hypothetical protein ALUC_70
MRFTEAVVAVAACLAQVQIAQAALAFTHWPTTIDAGAPTTLNWDSDSDAPVTITLRKGAAADLDTVQVLTKDAKGGSYTWTPDNSLEPGSDYAFQIDQDGQVNYSGLVTLNNDSERTAATSAASSTTSTQETTTASQTQTTPTPTPTDTAPRDEVNSVLPGNNATTNFTLDANHDSNSNVSSKSAMAAAMQNGGAPFQMVSLDLVLGIVAMGFYLVC